MSKQTAFPFSLFALAFLTSKFAPIRVNSRLNGFDLRLSVENLPEVHVEGSAADLVVALPPVEIAAILPSAHQTRAATLDIHDTSSGLGIPRNLLLIFNYPVTKLPNYQISDL